MPPDRTIKNKAFKPHSRVSTDSATKKTTGRPRGRPPGSTTTAKKATATSKRRSIAVRSDDEDDDDDDDGDDNDMVDEDDGGNSDDSDIASNNNNKTGPSGNGSKGKSGGGKDERGPRQAIPAELLRTLVQHHFRDGEMRVNAEASLLVGKYMETFVREAIARAVYERAEAKGDKRKKKKSTDDDGDGGSRGGAAAADDFLEVEDLEKLAPQLLLDF